MKKPNKNAAGRQRAQRGGHSQADSVQLDHPEPAKAYINQGMSYTELEQYQTAINDYNKAIQLDPNEAILAQAYGNRDNGYDYLGQYQRAIQNLGTAIQLDPDYAWAHYIRAFVYRNLGQYTLANAGDAMACSLDRQYS